MKKCSCSIRTMTDFALQCSNHPYHVPLQYAQKCNDCGRLTQIEGGVVLKYFSRNSGSFTKVLCNDCKEIAQCFICTIEQGKIWQTLKDNQEKIGLGRLPEYLSPSAQAYLIERVDQWWEREELLLKQF